jgi:hypothetical protein
VISKTEHYSKKPWNIEFVKLMYDYLKHITTLCTGSILVVVAFYEKASLYLSWRLLLKLSLVAFVVSIISSTVALLEITTLSDPEFSTKGSEEGLWGHSKPATIAFVLTWGAFVFALVLLIVFGFKNL